jgi:hypothetical protein
MNTLDGFTVAAGVAWILKDPSAVLTYGLGWEDWLTGSDLLSTASWTIPAGLTLLSQSLNGSPLTVGDRTYAANTCALVRISGGTANVDYTCVCQITTVAGDIDERSIIVKVRDR